MVSTVVTQCQKIPNNFFLEKTNFVISLSINARENLAWDWIKKSKSRPCLIYIFCGKNIDYTQVWLKYTYTKNKK